MGRGLQFRGVAPRRTAHAAEMVTQVLLGMPVKIYEQQGEWCMIETPERYVGWIRDQCSRTDRQRRNYLQQPKVIISALCAFLCRGG